LISEGSSKLASVPSGGAGGAAPAAGGAAAGGAAEAAPAEEKEEGMLIAGKSAWILANAIHREGRVRRGYGFRSFRLRNQLTWLWMNLLSKFRNMDNGHLEEVVRACAL
jgi:methyl coenzyme M reductase alpha subunit